MSARRVSVICAALLAVALAVRAVPAFGGYFYWDDLILVGRAGTRTCCPGVICSTITTDTYASRFLLGGLITRAAPLVWFWPALSLVLLLRLLAWLALLRTLHIILGRRPVLLVPWTFALFTRSGFPASPGGPRA